MQIENPPSSSQDSQEQELSNDRLSSKEILENDLRKAEAEREQLRANGRNTVKMDEYLEELTQKWETAENTVTLPTPKEMSTAIESDLRKLETEREQLRGYDGRDTGKIDTELERLTQKLDRVRSAIAAKNAEQETGTQEIGGSKEVDASAVNEDIDLPTNIELERSSDIVQNVGDGSVSVYETNAQNSAKSTLPVFGAAAAASLNQLPQDQGTKIKGVDTGVEHTVALPPKPKGVDTGMVQTVAAPEDFQARYDREVLACKKEYQHLTPAEVQEKEKEIVQSLERRISFFAAREKIRKDEFAGQKPSEMSAKELRKFNDRMYKLEQDIAQNEINNAAKVVNTPPTAQTEIIAVLSEAQDTKNKTFQEKIKKYWSGLSKTDKILWPTLVAGLLGSGAFAYNSIYGGDVVKSSTSKKSVDGGKVAQNKLKDLGVVMAGSDKDSELTLAMLRDSNSTERDFELEKEAQKAVDLSAKTLEMMNKKNTAPSVGAKQEMSQVDRANELAAKMGIKEPKNIKYQGGVAIQIDGQMVDPGFYTKEEIKMIQSVHSGGEVKPRKTASERFRSDRIQKNSQKEARNTEILKQMGVDVDGISSYKATKVAGIIASVNGVMVDPKLYTPKEVEQIKFAQQIGKRMKSSEVDFDDGVNKEIVKPIVDKVEIAPKPEKRIGWGKLPEKELTMDERTASLLSYVNELREMNNESKLQGNSVEIDGNKIIKIDNWRVPKDLQYYKLPKSQKLEADDTQEVITPMEQSEVVTPTEIVPGKLISMDVLMDKGYEERLDEVQQIAQNMGIASQDVKNILFGDDDAKTILEINGRSV